MIHADFSSDQAEVKIEGKSPVVFAEFTAILASYFRIEPSQERFEEMVKKALKLASSEDTEETLYEGDSNYDQTSKKN